jgi:hypothetical protein
MVLATSGSVLLFLVAVGGFVYVLVHYWKVLLGLAVMFGGGGAAHQAKESSRRKGRRPPRKRSHRDEPRNPTPGGR